jgi:N-terminal acetyltransferase B complex non-catalytic subunit
LFQSPNATETETEAYLKEFLRSPPSHTQLKDPQHFISDIEDVARICHGEMTHIIVSNFDSTRWNDANFQTTLDSSNAHLISRLEQTVVQIKNLKAIVPAFADVLHLLYTTYDISLITLAFCKLLNAKNKKLQSSQATHTAHILTHTQELQKAIAEKATAVKRGLDEGGWIDKVLDSVNGVDGQETVLGQLGDLVDAGRLEVWAGDLVEGWKDSCEGLMLLKVVQ